MGRPYSDDLRERIVDAVEGGGSRRGAAGVFGVSPSCAIKLLQRWQRTGSVSPAPLGAPKRSKLDPVAEWLLALVKVEPDRKSTRLNSSHIQKSRMPSSA